MICHTIFFNIKKLNVFFVTQTYTKCFQIFVGFNILRQRATCEITIKGARGANMKVLFQGLHMTCVILMLVYNLKLYISNTPFSTTF
jgi:hypothetical protein